MNTEAAYYLRQRLVFGGVLIAIGVALMLDRFDVIDLPGFWHYWPAILVLIGLNKLIGGTHAKQVLQGLWLIFIGAWLYVSIEQLWGLNFHNTWPFFLIAWGVGMLLRPFLAEKFVSSEENHHDR